MEFGLDPDAVLGHQIIRRYCQSSRTVLREKKMAYLLAVKEYIAKVRLISFENVLNKFLVLC